MWKYSLGSIKGQMYKSATGLRSLKYDVLANFAASFIKTRLILMLLHSYISIIDILRDLLCEKVDNCLREKTFVECQVSVRLID